MLMWLVATQGSDTVRLGLDVGVRVHLMVGF